jgi:AraC family transcriptional regulator
MISRVHSLAYAGTDGLARNIAEFDRRPVVSPDRAAHLQSGRSPAVGQRPFERFDAETRQGEDGVLDLTEVAATEAALVISPADSVTRRRASWRGMSAETIRATRHGRLEMRFRAPFHLLILLESGSRSDGSTYVEGLRLSALKDYKRKLVFVPAGREYIDHQETRDLPRITCFFFDPRVLPGGGDVSLPPRVFIDDAELLNTAFRLTSALESPLAHDRAYCEALGVVLAHDLARLGQRGRWPERSVQGGLAAWQEQAVKRHIDERIADHVSLAALAALVRLSPCHFSRAFKQSLGMPPHRYHIHRRIARAKELLADPDRSVMQIAISVGFSSASSFNGAFRKAMGVTPSEHRRTVV